MDEDTVPKTAGLTAPEFDSLRFRLLLVGQLDAHRRSKPA